VSGNRGSKSRHKYVLSAGYCLQKGRRKKKNPPKPGSPHREETAGERMPDLVNEKKKNGKGRLSGMRQRTEPTKKRKKGLPR